MCHLWIQNTLTERESLRNKLRKLDAESEVKEARNRKKTRPKPVEFIGVDGEGITTPSGEHLYTLLAASDSSYVSNPSGLSTRDCFDWFFRLKESHPEATFVSFYFTYDVNMILRDVPHSALDYLRDNNNCFIYDTKKQESIRIAYYPKKWFSLSIGKRQNGRYVSRLSLRIWDVFGFFQKSFAKALEDFKIGTPSELNAIQNMKDARADFADLDSAKIAEYNALECRLLVLLMEKLQSALETAGINLTQWHGAGAVAGELMRKHNIKTFVGQAKPTHELAVQSAYFGGRIQTVKIGEFKPVYGHDIVSAYPSTIATLANLKGCRQTIVTSFDSSLQYTIWHVRWKLPDTTLFCPFPFRDRDGGIHYPYEGEGYYWNCEVSAALAHFKTGIDVLEGYSFIPSDDRLPFSFVRELFELRKQFKLDGNDAQIALKLGLNSLYGKTAQGVGWRNTRPPYQSYVWAGIITAETRAKMFALATKKPSAIIAYATDGLYATKPLTQDDNGSLGGWQSKRYDSLLIIQPGVYLAADNQGSERRTRGFRTADVDFAKVRDEWERNAIAGSLDVPSRRFVGLKDAGQDYSQWRKWLDKPRRLSFYPQRGIPTCVQDCPPVFRLLPESFAGRVSLPYETPQYYANEESSDAELLD